MRWNEVLTEHYVNLFSIDEKQQYADQVFDLIQIAYDGIGGHCKIASAKDLIENSGMWKLVRRDGKIVFAAIYKDPNGMKRMAIGHDGSRSAKLELRKMMIEDIKMKRSWGEVSGASAKVALSLGVPAVPNTEAARILGKEILGYHGKYAYDREIGGQILTKVIIGYPNGENIGDTLTHETVNELMQLLSLEH